jgi:membrane protease YdiL (CAAX protease family)
MKNLLSKYPNVVAFALAVILCATALALADWIGKLIHFPYAGLLLLVAATWYLYKRENRTLQEIGLNLRIRNVSFLLPGLALGIASFAISTYARTLFTGEQWHVNPNIQWDKLAEALYVVLPTAATQQLIFRGYAFKKTIEVSNLFVANLIWGLLFVAYHDIWGNLMFLPFAFLALFLSHYVFSSALLKSGTLYFAIGIHWGHNWSSQHFNGYKITDAGIFYITNQQNYNSWLAYLILWLAYSLGFIILALAFWKWKGVPLPTVKQNITLIASQEG